VFDDLSDPLDPLDPLHPFLWADWVCPECAEDGSTDELDRGRCPQCGAEVERLGTR
jgi:hypothetical protein